MLVFLFKQKTAYDMRISDWEFRRVLFGSWRQVVVDLLGVVPGDRRLAVETGQESGAGLGGLVERQRGPGHLCEDGEQAGAGRRFHDERASTHSSRPDRSEPRSTGTEG